jgi:uncharacterized protein YkwD
MARTSVIFLSMALLMLIGATSASAFRVSRLMAPPAVCANQFDDAAPAKVQEDAMDCMTNYARQRDHRRRFGELAKLNRSAEHKSHDILRCNSFSHFACGRQFTYWMGRYGYLRARCWRAGENIAWGVGPYGSVRAIFRAWMHSSGHRRNILSRGFDQLGVGLDVGSFVGRSDIHVWTQEFGSHCGHPGAEPPRIVPLRARLGNEIALP